MFDKARPGMTFLLIALICAIQAESLAQQPFFTDDADTTARRKFHFEFANEFDILQRSAFPNLRQNASSFTLNYGLTDRVELGLNIPVIAIFNDRSNSPRNAFGFGDTNLSVKYNFRKERQDSPAPALTVSFNLEVPTGDKDRQLGSALLDYSFNGVAQKTLSERVTLRLNTGVLFSGNTLTGAVGIRARGTVFTGGASLVRQFTPKLDLGVEVTGAVSSNANLGAGLLQFQMGGNYALKEGMTLDFGLLGGRFSASPRAGAQLGVSVDF
ncbi:MAG TPA: transporter [Blastocatellia bacterium]|nr:transporter [Blastocatellia bacterium]